MKYIFFALTFFFIGSSFSQKTSKAICYNVACKGDLTEFLNDYKTDIETKTDYSSITYSFKGNEGDTLKMSFRKKDNSLSSIVGKKSVVQHIYKDYYGGTGNKTKTFTVAKNMANDYWHIEIVK